MADSVPSANALSPPPQAPAAPGQQDYNSGVTNGSSSASHMPPPPLPPVVIPGGSNPIPSAVGSPFAGSSTGGLGSPAGTPRRAAPEPNKRALYVGGLDPRVTEDVLRQIFETAGHVQSVKIIPDKNVGLAPSLSSSFKRAMTCHITVHKRGRMHLEGSCGLTTQRGYAWSAASSRLHTQREHPLFS